VTQRVAEVVNDHEDQEPKFEMRLALYPDGYAYAVFYQTKLDDLSEIEAAAFAHYAQQWADIFKERANMGLTKGVDDASLHEVRDRQAPG
jgi:hypothetical protein